MDAPEQTFYDRVGGHETFTRLVEVFYAGVADDEVLRPLYPEQDLGPAAERLRMFLEQYWGGPTTYSDQRGHPASADAAPPLPRRCLGARPVASPHAGGGRRHSHLEPELENEFWNYLVMAAHSLVNTIDEPPSAVSSEL